MRKRRQHRKKRRLRRKRILLLLFTAAVLFSVCSMAAAGVSTLQTVRAWISLPFSEGAEDDLKTLLQNNPETAGFVADYRKKSALPPSDTIGDLKDGEIPLLLQWDERWGYQQYGDGMIAETGCGPTCIAMVAAGLCHNPYVTPYIVAQAAEQQGYYIEGTGTSWRMMTDGVLQFGITGEEVTKDEAVSCLQQGGVLICSVGPGDFTSAGHFIVLTGIHDGMISVHDPNSRIRSKRQWEASSLFDQIRNIWSYAVKR